MTYLQITLALAALGTVMSYARRINDVSWRTHRATCVLCWVILGTLWYHLAATASAWRFGPPLTATKP